MKNTLIRQTFALLLFIMMASHGSVIQNTNERGISAPLNKLNHHPSTINEAARKSRALHDEWKREEKRTQRFTNDPSCGIIPKSSSSRIVNGQDSERGMWPWMVMMLRINAFQSYSQYCGASLLNRRWVLTAAHCFSREPYSDTQLAFGALYKNLTEDSVKLVAIDSIHCHKDYDNVSNHNDICLLKLAGEISFTDYIVPACLPQNNTIVPDDTNCTVIGWGDTKGTANNALLQEATVKIINRTQCTLWYRQEFIDIPENHICAGFPNGGIDSCQGDSGGPLICPYPTQSTPYVINGITSFGVGCAEKERPGVYVAVARYLDWIDNMITANNADNNQCFSISTISCTGNVTRNGTIIRTPVENTETWLYPPNADCTWMITAPTGYNIRFNFICHFQIEVKSLNNGECYDSITISSPNTVVRYDKCGSRLPQHFTIPNTEALIRFQSDSTKQSYGFVIEITFVPDGQISALTTAAVVETTSSTTDSITETETPNNLPTVEQTSSHSGTDDTTVKLSSTIHPTLESGITSTVENITSDGMPNVSEVTLQMTASTQGTLATYTDGNNSTSIEQTSVHSLNTGQMLSTKQVLQTTLPKETVTPSQSNIVNMTVSSANTTSRAISSLQVSFGIAICTSVTVTILGNILY